MGPNQSFLGFVKHTPRDSSEGWAYINKHMWSSSSLRKNKRGTCQKWWGKNWERNVSKPVFHERVTFEYDTLSLALCLGWKNHLSPDHTPIRLQIGLWSLLLSQYFQDSCRVVNMFKKISLTWKAFYLRRPFLQSLILLLRRPSLSQSWITCYSDLHQILLPVSCHWCGIH